MTTPDVTVIVAVYNTMPYLTACLTSLVGQTIGADRMEIILVDDGSTDGSPAEVDRFARRHPGLVQVIHQANSGGPAAPSNRGLERATGRYVFFVGADDYLGREALERLVAAGDRLGADVVLGKSVGVNQRYIDQAIFTADETDITLFDSPLPWSLANTKLFRRELVEEHGLRFPEDMPVGSDQPFTIEACLRARRISVLADYDYYHAVKRYNAGNITYRSDHRARLACAERLIAFVADRVEAGKHRDAVLVRHFTWEVGKLVRADLLRQDRAVQQDVYAGVRALARDHLSDELRDRLPVSLRVRLGLARHGELDDLLAAIRADAAAEPLATVREGDRWYAAYPGFRDPRLGLADAWYEVTDSLADWIASLWATTVSWERRAGGWALAVTARSPHPDLADLCGEPVRLLAGDVPATDVTLAADDTGTTVRARLPVAALATGNPGTIRAEVTVRGSSGSAPVRAPRGKLASRRMHRLTVLTPHATAKGNLAVAAAPLTPDRVAAHLRRRWFRGGN